MTTFPVEIFSLTQKELSVKNATCVTINTYDGEISLYAHHMPLITHAMPGTLLIKEGHESQKFDHTGGILVAEKNSVSFFQTQKEEPLMVSKPVSERKISAEEVTKQMINEFIKRLSQKESMSSS